jgi:hypothetical protein
MILIKDLGANSLQGCINSGEEPRVLFFGLGEDQQADV